MSSRQTPPQTDHFEDITWSDHEHLREQLNDQLLSQHLATGDRDATQTYASATYVGDYPNYATHHFTPSIHSPSSRGNTWDFQRMSDEFAALAAASRNTLHATRTPIPSHPRHYMHTTREESVIPEGAVFPIDIPHTTATNSTSFSNSEVGERRRNNPTPQRIRRAYYAHVDPLGGRTLVPSTVSYDDHNIPQYDSAWLIYPDQHPWIRSREAYLCHYNFCNTIVQQRNRRNHNIRAHVNMLSHRISYIYLSSIPSPKE
ncbi:hypothetical protein Clacol_002201 [Clathrus columnatus]|uniref:C2H2-type domain-containing protein n=1 Tax=Clathrus columnatus TaxID=1419009 RepID=A0AAV5A053_9AGAM|nr:hypothetical protein Clacol_002201 [Clathrus columnatus]